MRHFLFETKEYRINPYFKRRRSEQDSAQALAHLLQRLSPRHRGKSGGGKRGTDTRQKCTVKMQYSNSTEAHRFQVENYLVLEGKGIDGGRPELYGTDSTEYRNNMVGKNFRIFLSPQSDKIDLQDLSKNFIKRLEQQTGYTLYWQAANHYDTAHPHAHLLINGKDKSGKEVAFPRDVVKTFMREYARNLCTAQIGRRTQKDLEIEKERELEARRFTRLDNTIAGLCEGTLRVNPAWVRTDRERMLARLENLRKMNLAAYRDGAYRLSPNWKEDLQANGRYNAFLDARSGLRYSDPANLKIYSGEQGTVTGKATKVYRTDGDASDNHAVIIEALDGRAYFVPLFKRPVAYEGKNKSYLKEGEFVTLKPLENQKGRLTPMLFKRDMSQIQKDIRKNGYTNSLTDDVAKEFHRRKT
jgi:hypothetical protein